MHLPSFFTETTYLGSVVATSRWPLNIIQFNTFTSISHPFHDTQLWSFLIMVTLCKTKWNRTQDAPQHKIHPKWSYTQNVNMIILTHIIFNKNLWPSYHSPWITSLASCIQLVSGYWTSNDTKLWDTHMTTIFKRQSK